MKKRERCKGGEGQRATVYLVNTPGESKEGGRAKAGWGGEKERGGGGGK